MSGLDLILLIFYGASVGVVIYRAIASLFVDEAKIEWDEEGLQEQLAQKKIAEKIKIQFKLKERYKYDELQDLAIAIENKSEGYIYIDWEQSRLIDDGKRSQRIVRVIPGMPFDVLPPQVRSVILPGETNAENLTVESVLKRSNETEPLKIEGSLVKLSKFKPERKKKPPKPPPEDIKFTLRLALGWAEEMKSDRQTDLFILKCEFTARRLSWKDARPRPKDK